MGSLRAIPKGFWMSPLDFNLHTTPLHGEPRISFSQYISQPELPCPSSLSFPQFHALPNELQLLILFFCDIPTLFRLMQTSSTMRAEASKLFWSSPASYCIEGEWLLSGGHPGTVYHDLDFLIYVERIEVSFHYIASEQWMRTQELDKWRDCRDSAFGDAPWTAFQGEYERIQKFWQTIQNRFPRVIHVTLSQMSPRVKSELPPYIIKKIAERSPPGVSVSASFLRGDGSYECRLERRVWQPVKVGAEDVGEWEERPGYTEKKVLLPHKVFRGPVGAYQSFGYKHERFLLQRDAVQVLLVTALERYHFYERHEPFSCFAPTCNAWFEKPEEYTLHAIRTGHHRSAELPEDVKASFEQNEHRLKRLEAEISEIINPIIQEWGDYGTESRLIVEEAFLYQLDHDPLYAEGKPASECETWYSIKRYIDPI